MRECIFLELFYLDNNNTVVGSIRTVTVKENDNVVDMANQYKTGFQDLLIANPESHHWSPEPHTNYLIPLCIYFLKKLQWYYFESCRIKIIFI